MANPSNLYAEKIYSEHPLVLWALDDTVDYKSLISEAQRNVATLWTPTSAALAASSADIDEPFLDSNLSRIRVNVPASETLEASIISPNILNFNHKSQLCRNIWNFKSFRNKTPFLIKGTSKSF